METSALPALSTSSGVTLASDGVARYVHAIETPRGFAALMEAKAVFPAEVSVALIGFALVSTPAEGQFKPWSGVG